MGGFAATKVFVDISSTHINQFSTLFVVIGQPLGTNILPGLVLPGITTGERPGSFAKYPVVGKGELVHELLAKLKVTAVVGLVKSQIKNRLLSEVTTMDCCHTVGANTLPELVGRAVHGGAVLFQVVVKLKE